VAATMRTSEEVRLETPEPLLPRGPLDRALAPRERPLEEDRGEPGHGSHELQVVPRRPLPLPLAVGHEEPLGPPFDADGRDDPGPAEVGVGQAPQLLAPDGHDPLAALEPRDPPALAAEPGQEEGRPRAPEEREDTPITRRRPDALPETIETYTAPFPRRPSPPMPVK
jgi:hypothetical protein